MRTADNAEGFIRVPARLLAVATISIILGSFYLATVPQVHATPALGDVLTRFDSPHQGNPRGIAFDGTDIWITNVDSRIFKITTDGAPISSIPEPESSISSLAWDHNTGRLWAGSYTGTGNIYRLNPADGSVQLTLTPSTAGKLGEVGLIDGLGFDERRNSLWYSYDVYGSTEAYEISAVDGSDLRKVSFPSDASGTTIDNTGCVWWTDVLNGFIRATDPRTGKIVGTIATPEFGDENFIEDLGIDDSGPTPAIWAHAMNNAQGKSEIIKYSRGDVGCGPIEIDKAFALDGRIDVGTPATLLFHGRWSHNQSDIASTIQVNGTDYTTNATGWIQFEYASSEVANLTFVVTGAESGGVTEYIQTAPPVSVVWDGVSVELEVDDVRIDVGSEARISWTAAYAYDQQRFDGTITLSSPLTSEEVGLVEYTVAEIEDPLHGLTAFTGNTVSVVFDMVNISLSASRFDVGSEADILVDAVYAYDGDPLSGTVALNDTLTQTEVDSYGYTTVSVTDELHGLTVFQSDAVTVIFDRIVVTLSVFDDWIGVDSAAAISWEGYYEFDGEPFVGSLTLNDTLSQASVGRYGYTVWGITDEIDGLSAFASNSVAVIFDRVSVTLTVEDDRVDVGVLASISYDAYYEYDGSEFQGAVLLNDTLIHDLVGRYGYSVSDINDELHGLTVFQGNSVSVIFDRVRIQLSAEDTRINADSSAVVVWSAIYEHDDAPFQGSVSLNNPLSRSDVGAYLYRSASISDDLYGLSAFTSNEVEVIFDKVSVKLSVSSRRIGVGSTAQILVEASYMHDEAPYDGEVLFSEELTQTEVGEYLYEVASISGDTYGITVFEANSISIIFDRVLVQLSAPDRWPVETTVPITWSAYYEFDGEPFLGTIILSEETTQSQVGAYEFALTAIGDDLYEVAAFAVEPVTIVFEEPVLKPEAVAAVAGVSLAGALAVAVSNMWERVQQIGVEIFGRLSGLLPEPVVDVVKYFFEGVLETRGVVEVKLAEAPLILTRQELVPLSIAGGTLALAFSYGLAPTLGDILPLLPLTLATAVGVELIKELARELTARRTGNWSEYRLWPLGLITMTISTALFKTPFSVPAKSWFHMASPSKRNEGMIAAASSVAGLLAAGVFFVLVLFGARTLGSMGLSISLALALYELFPTRPLNGKAVFDWSKPLWALLFALSAVLYALHVLALV